MQDYSAPLSAIAFCAVDLETTGINPLFHRIVEVGMVRFSVSGIHESFGSLVNPGIPIPAEATGIHGITCEMVAPAPPIEDLLDEITRMADRSLLVIHNPHFDMAFIARAFQRSGRPVPPMEAIDTVRLARIAWPGLDNHRLGTVRTHLGLEPDGHRAVPDAMACAAVLGSVLDREDPRGEWTVGDLRSYHGAFISVSRMRVRRDAGRCNEARGMMAGRKVRITYRDGGGRVTTRTIEPREFITIRGSDYVHALCELRGETRYFRIDRILEIRY